MDDKQILAMIGGAEPDVRVGFILTREGRFWDPDGLDAATAMVDKLYPPPAGNPAGAGILWTSGTQVNDPRILAAMLEARPDAYVVISRSPRSVLVPNDDGKAGILLAKALLECDPDPDDSAGPTSWEILNAALDTFAPEEALR